MLCALWRQEYSQSSGVLYLGQNCLSIALHFEVKSLLLPEHKWQGKQISPHSLQGQTDIASSDFRYYGDHAFQKLLTQFLQYKWMVRKSCRDNRQWLGTLYVLLYKKKTAGMKVSLRSSRQEQISNAYSMPNYHRMTTYCRSKINIITVQEYNSNSPVHPSL